MSITHWLDVEIWGPMWPNIFAPSFFTLAAVGVSHARTRLHIRNSKQATTAATTAAVAGQLAEQRQQINQQLAAHCADIKQHVSAVADAQASAGAGSNPAKSEGLPADQPVADPPLGGERVVPPAATVDPRKIGYVTLDPKTTGRRKR